MFPCFFNLAIATSFSYYCHSQFVLRATKVYHINRIFSTLSIVRQFATFFTIFLHLKCQLHFQIFANFFQVYNIFTKQLFFFHLFFPRKIPMFFVDNVNNLVYNSIFQAFLVFSCINCELTKKRCNVILIRSLFNVLRRIYES